MTRREYISIVSKASLLATLPFSQLLEACAPTSDLGVLLKENELAFIGLLSETLIPETETIGARAAGVPFFIDLYLKNFYDDKQQGIFLKQLQAYNAHLMKLKIDLSQVNEELTTQFIKDEGTPPEQTNSFASFLKEFKTIMVKGYFFNEQALKENLNFLPVPGHYTGEVELTKDSKTWVN